MFEAILNLAGLVLMVIVACHTIVLHRRLTRLRAALAEAGTVLPSLDASVGRMSEVVNGFAQRLQADLSAVEARLASARRVAAELASVNRSAEEASVNLDRLLRQHRRMGDARPTPVPREFVEPKGFAERAGLPQIAQPSSADPIVRPDPGRPDPGRSSPGRADNPLADDLRTEPRRRVAIELVS
jgi:hypothetical protein